ncbi:MAG: 8-oxoguanine deaminase [Acidimicrobiales bacterium]|nr:8-oxoguanine deaminase [Acidimicrobiales bacterium]
MTGTTASYWCEQAWLGGPAARAGVVIGVADGRIVSVESDVATPPAGARRRPGLTLPGFANGHSHAFHRALRGRTHAQAGSFWTWRDQMYRAAATLDPDRYHRLARAVFAEMALAGFTCVGEFHYLHHGPGGVAYADPNAMGDALVAAAAEAGIRITLLDACYLHGGIGAELTGVQRRCGDGSVEAWAQRVAQRRAEPHLRLGAAVHSVRACEPDEIRAVAAWARAADVPLHAHVSEQPAENDMCLAAYGRTPTGVLAEAGALGPAFTAVHATHVTEADIALLTASSATCCLCPTTERDLADGIGPAGRLAAASVPLTLGSDSHAVIDGLEEARAVELDERLASRERGRFGAATLLDALTAAGHRSLGWTDAGHLAPGGRADLVTVSVQSVRLAGSDATDLLAAVVFAGTAADVTHVTVDGVDVVDAGQHLRIDVPDALAQSIAAVHA